MTPGFFDRPFAHRGLHDAALGRVENSASAVRAAVEAGYAIEIDVQRTADNRPVVFHDDILERLTPASGRVSDLTVDALAALPLTGSDDTPQPLSAILALIDGRVPLAIEVKDQDGRMGPDVGPLEAAIAAQLVEYDGPVAVMSFNPHSMRKMRRLAPGVPRGLVACTAEGGSYDHIPPEWAVRYGALEDFADVGASFVSWGMHTFPDAGVAALRAAGTPVLSWTIRNEEDAAHARRYADQITFEGFLPRE